MNSMHHDSSCAAGACRLVQDLDGVQNVQERAPTVRVLQGELKGVPDAGEQQHAQGAHESDLTIDGRVKLSWCGTITLFVRCNVVQPRPSVGVKACMHGQHMMQHETAWRMQRGLIQFHRCPNCAHAWALIHPH